MLIKFDVAYIFGICGPVYSDLSMSNRYGSDNSDLRLRMWPASGAAGDVAGMHAGQEYRYTYLMAILRLIQGLVFIKRGQATRAQVIKL